MIGNKEIINFGLIRLRYVLELFLTFFVGGLRIVSFFSAVVIDTEPVSASMNNFSKFDVCIKIGFRYHNKRFQ